MNVSGNDFLVTRALADLDSRLPDNQKQIDLYVVGGYALQLMGVRTDIAEATDVDYIGTTFDIGVKALLDAVGLKYGLGKGWINNDLLLNESDSLSELEALVGKLEFIKVDLPALQHFQIYAAIPESVLRMKIVAIDTTLTQYLDETSANDYVRPQDFGDVTMIVKQLGWSPDKLVRLVNEMGEAGYLLVPRETAAAVRQSLRTGNIVNILDAARRVEMVTSTATTWEN